jgi:hypothetical protein
MEYIGKLENRNKNSRTTRAFLGPPETETECGNNKNHQLMIERFRTGAEMVRHHAAMYGDAGALVAEAVLKYACLWPGLDPLDFRVILAPIELGPYNKHIGYTRIHRDEDAPRYILGNRHICTWREDGSIALIPDHQLVIDFLVHEMCHHRQADIVAEGSIRQLRGGHRDAGWYRAISEATPDYLGVEFPEDVWPKQKPKPGRLTEVEVCHWPDSFRPLIADENDARLRRTSASADRKAT